MNLQAWQSVQEVFFRALELPLQMSAGERRSAVLDMCGGDSDLCAEVMAMIEEDRLENPLLDGGLGNAARTALDLGSLPALVERQIGPYRLVRLLGEGGMGVVYLADRTDIHGQVAIKLLRDAWLSPMRRQRFLLEELTLAQLNHPSIARIYDAGTLEDGTPWFVMEYAEGVPLTAFRSEYGATIRSALEVFQRVCEAVRHANTLAIIHRDLKPSNILVNDGGDVKLLDFGIAKQLNEGNREGNRDRQLTQTGLRMMTLSYAAPEQLTNGPVGLYTDAYSLGVVLYELITGRLPKRLHAGDPANALDHWADEKPSAVVRRESPELRDQLSKSEWADLDVIVSKALEPDMDRRYGSAEALLRDITALLTGDPLETRRSDWPYIVSKFIRRHKGPLMTAAAALAAIGITIGLYTVRLAHARNAALSEAARTMRIQRFTEDLFQGGDPSAGPASDLRVLEILERGRNQAAALQGDPEMQADMQEMLGSVYQKLGRLDVADPLLTAAFEHHRQTLGPEDAKTGKSLIALSLLRKDQGRLPEAEQLARQAIEMQRSEHSASSQYIANSLLALGSILEIRGSYTEARSILQEALREETATSRDSAESAEILTELANVEFYEGHYDLAGQLNQRALDLNRRLLGAQHPSVADGLNNLGAVESNRGNYAAAEAYYREALGIAERWYGPEHPEVAANLTALAQTLTSEKRFNEAEALLQRALSIQQHQSGPVRATVGTTLNQLGVLAFQQDQYDKARGYFTRAMDTWRTLYGDQHPFIANAISNLGSICLQQKDYPCAEKMFRDAVRRFDAISPQSLSAAVAHLKLGRTLLREGRYSDAEPNTLAAFNYLQGHVVATDSYLAASKKDLAAIRDQTAKSPKSAVSPPAEMQAAKANPSR